MLPAPEEEVCGQQALPGSESFSELSVRGAALRCVGGLGSFSFVFRVPLRVSRVSWSCADSSSCVALVLGDQLNNI